MKTFKLVSLTVLEKQDEELISLPIPLKDGLIINREDEQNRWLIEAYLDKSYKEFFEKLKNNGQEKVLQVKITKETNDPATFIVQILSINDIGDHINVLFMGTIINRNIKMVEKMLKNLIEQGLQGKSLLEEFKKKMKEVNTPS